MGTYVRNKLYVTGFDFDAHNNQTHFSPLLNSYICQLTTYVTVHACIGG